MRRLNSLLRNPHFSVLASVMYVNNEIGVVQDIPRIGELCRSRGVIFHVDAAQATGKVEIDLDDVIKSKLDFDANGHYSRDDIFTYSVADQPDTKKEQTELFNDLLKDIKAKK